MTTDGRPESIEALQARLVDHALPGGTCAIPAYEHWLAADAMLAPELPAGEAHPLYIFYLALLGMGCLSTTSSRVAGAHYWTASS